MRVERPVCLHGALMPVCAKCVASSQVSFMSDRPAVGHAGAALRSLVTKETSLHRTATSFRHEPQVCQVGSFTARPTGSFSHVPPLSPLLCRMLLRRMFAALAASWRAPSPSPPPSRSSSRARSARGSTTPSPRSASVAFRGMLFASPMQLRRLYGGREGAAAWRPWLGDSGGRCGRQRCVAACFFLVGAPLLWVYRICVCTCVRKVLFFGVVAACVRVACAHLLFWTLAVMWVCGSCVYGTVKNLHRTP